MIGVIAHWEDIEETPYLKHIWKDTVRPLFGTHLYFVDEDGTAPKELDLNLTYQTFSSLSEIFKEHPDAHYVFLESFRNIPSCALSEFIDLDDFKHPKDNVFYVIGKDSDKLNFNYLPLSYSIVSIDTLNNFALWSVVVAGIALFSRYRYYGFEG